MLRPYPAAQRLLVLHCAQSDTKALKDYLYLADQPHEAAALASVEGCDSPVIPLSSPLPTRRLSHDVRRHHALSRSLLAPLTSLPRGMAARCPPQPSASSPQWYRPHVAAVHTHTSFSVASYLVLQSLPTPLPPAYAVQASRPVSSASSTPPPYTNTLTQLPLASPPPPLAQLPLLPLAAPDPRAHHRRSVLRPRRRATGAIPFRHPRLLLPLPIARGAHGAGNRRPSQAARGTAAFGASHRGSASPARGAHPPRAASRPRRPRRRLRGYSKSVAFCRPTTE
jgi:hypothetical protein